MTVKVPKCPECYSDLDFDGKCPICSLRKNHGKRKLMRKNKKDKFYEKHDKHIQIEEE